jgi:glycine betaine transporter
MYPGAWMLFFFGWFIGYGPLMGMLVARVSKGRTIRATIFSFVKEATTTKYGEP